MNTSRRCWIEVLSSLTGLELLADDLPSHKWLGYIHKASSNEGDVVLDPFGVCGTAVHAAQKELI